MRALCEWSALVPLFGITAFDARLRPTEVVAGPEHAASSLQDTSHLTESWTRSLIDVFLKGPLARFHAGSRRRLAGAPSMGGFALNRAITGET